MRRARSLHVCALRPAEGEWACAARVCRLHPRRHRRCRARRLRHRPHLAWGNLWGARLPGKMHGCVRPHLLPGWVCLRLAMLGQSPAWLSDASYAGAVLGSRDVCRSQERAVTIRAASLQHSGGLRCVTSGYPWSQVTLCFLMSIQSSVFHQARRRPWQPWHGAR